MTLDTLQTIHTPFEMESWDLDMINGEWVVLGHTTLIMCTCMPVDQYPLPWGHQEEES